MDIAFTYLPGDGIGPEVGAAAMTVLDAVAGRFGHTLDRHPHAFGGIAIDTHGTPLPETTLASAKDTGVVLLGAVGGPKWDRLEGADRPELGGLLPLRKALGLYANLRPAKPYSALADLAPIKPECLDGVDLLVVRELTGGIYFGEKGRTGGEAHDVMRYSEAEVERIARRAFEIARTRRSHVTSVDKFNVLECSRLWRDVVGRVHVDYPDIALDHILVDACAMHLLLDPTRFDVILTENMFGDILTDEASMLCGSLGVIPSASIGDDYALYEPIHGSAPDIAGSDRANPIAMILSVAMMLRMSFGLGEEADAVEAAVEKAIRKGKVTTDLGGRLGTHAVAKYIAKHVGT